MVVLGAISTRAWFVTYAAGSIVSHGSWKLVFSEALDDSRRTASLCELQKRSEAVVAAKQRPRTEMNTLEVHRGQTAALFSAAAKWVAGAWPMAPKAAKSAFRLSYGPNLGLCLSAH